MQSPMIVVVTAASVSQQAGAKLLFAKLDSVRHRFQRLITIWVDAGYRGANFIRWAIAVCSHVRLLSAEPARSEQN